MKRRPVKLSPEQSAKIEAYLTKAFAHREQMEEAEEDGLESPAVRWARLYERLRKETGFVQPLRFIIDGRVEWWFVKQFSLEDFDLVGSVFGRSGYSLQDLTDADAQAHFTVALLYVGVVADEDGDAAYFKTPDEARKFYEMPGEAADIARGLRDVLLSLNRFGDDVKKKMGVEVELSAPSTPPQMEVAPITASSEAPTGVPLSPANSAFGESGAGGMRERYARWASRLRFWHR